MQTKVRTVPVIPDHEVLRKIGGGAYGEVWLARGVTGALRAVKTVWHNDFEDERGFEREFQGILQYEPVSRNHPGLVHILHVGRGESDGEPFYYYVMELGDDVRLGRNIHPVEYEPRTLRSDMKAAEGEPLDVEECISTGRLLAEGLDHLHRGGLAHRDVKPSNVIFVDGKAKLADIGLVAQRGQQTFVGTEGFVPPEGPGSAEADVYSLGKVLYEMATGKDRLDFPELPDELPEGRKLKRWRLLNSVICDVCEPRIGRRKIRTAGDLATELAHLEAGRPRPLRMRAGAVAAGLLGLVAAVGGAEMLNWNEWRVTSVSSPIRPEEVELAPVTVTSYPHPAEVFDAEGKYLGDTPLRTMRLPVGTEVRFLIKKHDYREVTETAVVGEEGLVIDPTLTYFKPPEPGEWWEDILENRYRPEEDFHESYNYIGVASWMQFQEEKKVSFGKIVELSENGAMRQVVLATPAEARQFAKWLEQKCRENYLKEENWMEVRMDKGRDLSGVNPDWVRKGMRPFYCVVRREPRSVVSFTSDPPGAKVYLNGLMVGKTSVPTEWEPEPAPLEVSVIAGEVQLIMEMEGYKSYEQILQLKPGDPKWPEPLHIRLEREDIFGEPWVNSLGMRFVPIEDDLMAAVWETRVRDYEGFVKGSGGEVASAPPEFAQNDEHPVVNVSREEAMRFCEWLTRTERAKKLIAANHEYRLPTDLEWSMMAGLRGEAGEWPQDRDGQRDGYPWGPQWPPPPGAGNFSDEAANVPPREKIPGFHDGFEKTAPVGLFQPNALGLHDMAGNVREWVSDDYNSEGRHAVTRGGGWNSYQRHHLLTSARNIVPREFTESDSIYGFRVVLAKVPVVPDKEGAPASKP